MKLLQQELQAGTVVKAQAAFKLYDTYGFPFDLTQVHMHSQLRHPSEL